MLVQWTNILFSTSLFCRFEPEAVWPSPLFREEEEEQDFKTKAVFHLLGPHRGLAGHRRRDSETPRTKPLQTAQSAILAQSSVVFPPPHSPPQVLFSQHFQNSSKTQETSSFFFFHFFFSGFCFFLQFASVAGPTSSAVGPGRASSGEAGASSPKRPRAANPTTSWTPRRGRCPGDTRENPTRCVWVCGCGCGCCGME